jgi:phosphopantothenate synthetase
MSETKFELRQPVTPLSRTLREGEMATENVTKAVERLEAINAKLLTTLEAIQKELFEYSVANNFGKSRIVSRCIDLAREAIREVKGESLCQD